VELGLDADATIGSGSATATVRALSKLDNTFPRGRQFHYDVDTGSP